MGPTSIFLGDFNESSLCVRLDREVVAHFFLLFLHRSKNKPCLHWKEALFALKRSLVLSVKKPCFQWQCKGVDN